MKLSNEPIVETLLGFCYNEYKYINIFGDTFYIIWYIVIVVIYILVGVCIYIFEGR